MSNRSIQSALRGVGFTLPTPFSADGNTVVYDELEANVTALEDEGASLFIPCGNTGEYYSLSDEERVGVVETTVDAVDSSGTVIGGAGGSTKDVIELIEEYDAVGVDGVMIMYPSHVYSHHRGMIDYYETILSATDLPVVIYKRGPLVTTELLSELSDRDNFVGVKYAVNDVQGFAEAVATTQGDIVWINGIAERFAPAFALEGAEGFTTGIGNFVPGPVLELAEAIDAEEWEDARRIRDLLQPYENLRGEAVGSHAFSSAKNVPAVKYGMELNGWYGGPVREPLRNLSAEDKRRAKEYYEQIDSLVAAKSA